MQIEMIMVTYNNLESTQRTIASIQKFTKNVEYKLLVIDNNSTIQMREWLEQQDLNVHHLKDNVGVAEARNIGVKLLNDDCEYVLFVDNDIEVTQDDWLPKLLTGFIDKDIAAVGPCSNYVRGLQDVKLKTLKRYLSVSFLITFCVLIRRDVVDEIGDFDGFGEKWGNADIDYSVRIRQAGYKLINARDVFVEHEGFETKQAGKNLISLKRKFLEKWGFEIYDDLYDFGKWMNMPENKEESLIEVVGVEDGKRRQEIKRKIDQIGLNTQVISFQNQVLSLDNLPQMLSGADQQTYESKLDKNKRMALWELPARCNLGCSYCYVEDRKTDNQNYGPKHFSDWLYKVDNDAQWIIWLCSEGEPAFYPEYGKIIDRLIMRDGQVVATTTNLTQDDILNLDRLAYNSLGILWSVHHAELKRKGLIDKVFERAQILADKGASIAPAVIATRAHLESVEEINERFERIDLKPTLRHERIFPKNGQWYHREPTELWELQAIQRARDFGWSLINYDYEHLRFHVKGGLCSAGKQFLATLTSWDTVSCCGCGQQLAKFPELPLEYVQKLCTAECCPCPFPHELGMNSKILTPTMSQSYFYNNPESNLFKALDVYLLNGAENA